MDERIAIWNALHDGEITGATLEGNALVMFVNIPYVRARLAPLGDSFCLRLHGFRSLELSDSDGRKTSDLSGFAMSGIEINSTDSTSMPVKIATTSGYLTLDFDTLEIALDSGRVTNFREVDEACSSYWKEWSDKANQLK